LKGQFWLDLCATVPIDALIELFVSNENPAFEMFGILKLGRVLRLNKIIQYLNVEEDIKASMKITKMVLFLFIYIHLYACLWWITVKFDKSWVPPKDIYFGAWY
jgi:hypothetical protein